MPKALQAIGDEIWTLEQPFRLIGQEIGTRTTVIRLRDGSLWLHSPGPETGAAYRSLTALGPVKHLVAPNAFHHLFLPQASRLFPEATIWGPGAVRKKQPRLSIRRLSDELPAAWADDLELQALHGLKSQEYVFLHKPSRSLIVTDLLMHLHPDAAHSRLLFGLLGMNGQLAWDKALGPFLLKDPAALRRALQTVLDWDFERIVLSHGRLVEIDARARFAAALESLLMPARA